MSDETLIRFKDLEMNNIPQNNKWIIDYNIKKIFNFFFGI